MLLLPAPKPVPLLAAPRQWLALPRTASRKVRVFSFGGGVQSHAVLVLQALRRLENPYDVFVFANVGHDSENPETLDYLERYTLPFCEAYGIEFIQIQKMRGRGKVKTPDTLLSNIYRQEKSLVIPVRMGHNGAPGNRNCTEDYKIEVVARQMRTSGFTHTFIGLGISLDEFSRARPQYWYSEHGIEKKREYPLIDLRIDRQRCLDIIASVGLPEPPKSSCWFCPFKKRSEWIDMKREKPALFAQAVAVEHELNRKRLTLAKDRVFLHPDCVPLEYAVGDQPRLLTDAMMDACESGYCMT